MKKLFMIFFSAVMVLAVSSTAGAGYLDFNMDGTHPAGAKISYAGGSSSLVGEQISVDTVTWYIDPDTPGASLNLADALLTFTTGSHSGGWTWGSGGSISVVGDVPDLSLVGETLLSGVFNSAQVVAYDLGGMIQFAVDISSFTDEKNDCLEGYFGFNSDTPWVGGLNLSFTIETGIGEGEAFESIAVLSGDIYNTPVPIPAAFWLLGTGLLGLVGFRRFSR